MSGIYQLNQATGSVTLPSSGNTFIGTSTNSELYSVDSSGTVTVYGTGSGGGSSIDTGSFAVTASNSFTGSQTISGSVEITGSVNSNVTVGVRSQGLIQITDDDTASILPAYNTTGSINGMFLNSGSNVPISFVGTTEIPSLGGLTGGGFVLSSGSSIWAAGGQYSAGGTFTQLYYNPDYAGGNESYLVQVGDALGENRLVIQKADNNSEYVKILATDTTEGFVLDHSFSNSSASLFKVKDSGSVNTIFDITGTGTKAYRPLTGLSNDFTASVTGGGVYARISGSLTCSIQPNSVVPIPTGVEFEFFQYSNQQLHFDTGSGVILNSKNGYIKLAGQFSSATLKKVATDEWDLIGDLA
jgi:hypothetical protein